MKIPSNKQLDIIQKELSYDGVSIDTLKERHNIEASNNIFAQQYLESNNVPVNEYKKRLNTTGCGYFDYAVLHEYIRKFKPQYFLELGPGISTHVIADAMKRFCYDKYNGNIKLISMESNQEWYDHLSGKMPGYDFVELHYSKAIVGRILFFSGMYYKNIPEYPYDVVFVDGPPQEGCSTVDFLNLVSKSAKPITALIDNRSYTVMLYSFLFGNYHIKQYSPSFYVCGPLSKEDVYSEKFNGDMVHSRIAMRLLKDISKEKLFETGD